jgi:hypothetical protein
MVYCSFWNVMMAIWKTVMVATKTVEYNTDTLVEMVLRPHHQTVVITGALLLPSIKH